MSTRLLQPDDAPATAHSLAGAFMTDPMMQHLAPDEERRARMLPAYFRAVLRQTTDGVRRVALDNESNVCGAAVAMPPGTYPLPLLPQLAEWRTMTASGWRATLRHFREIPPIEATRPSEPFWYLMYIGVSPTDQGRGHGDALLREVVADADRDGLPTYLVTMKESNVAYYQRFGFQPRSELRMGRNGPATWTMLRPAGPASPG